MLRPSSAGVPDFETRIETIKKRPSLSKASTIVSNFYTAKRRAKAAQRAAQDQASEIVLTSSDDEEEEKTSPPRRNGTRSLRSFRSRPDPERGTDPLDLPKLVLVALASLIKHLEPFGLDRVFRHQSAFVPFASRAAMTLNGNTVSNLELLNNNTDFKENGSLVSILDRCKTAMGKRQLRRWVTKPLLSKE